MTCTWRHGSAHYARGSRSYGKRNLYKKVGQYVQQEAGIEVYPNIDQKYDQA